MLYASTSELPDSVKQALPLYGQELYRKSFNTAWGRYRLRAKLKGARLYEETAHHIAWLAVKNEYEMDKSGRWVKR